MNGWRFVVVVRERTTIADRCTVWPQEVREEGDAGLADAWLVAARGLRHLSAGPEVVIQPTTWLEVMSALASGQGVDVVGASGPLDYASDTEELAASIEVWGIAGGAFVPLP